MNYHKFSYLPSQRRALPSGTASATTITTTAPVSSSSIASSYVGRAGSTRCPIRVTPSALPSLICTILYSIEFQAPTGPRPLPDKQAASSHKAGSELREEDGSGREATTSALAAAALPSSVMLAVSALFGRSPAALPPPTQEEQTTVHDADAAELAAVERAQAAARRRMRDLPLVVPVTQVIHKLGGVYLVVRQTHCASVETAKERALRDVRLIVEQHKQQQQQQLNKSPALLSQRGESVRPAHLGIITASGSPTRASYHTNPAGGGEEDEEAEGRRGRPSFFSPSPSSELSRSLARPSTMFDPSIPATAAAAAAAANANSANALPANSTRTSMYATGAGNTAAFDVHADELGMELAVRLLTRETRWRMSHERPLAEWTFPIIRTKDEDTIMYLGKSSLRMRMSDQLTSGRASFAGPVNDATTATGGGGGSSNVNSTGSNYYYPPRANSPSFTRCSGVQSDFVFVNDASQVHDVLQFILKTFYEAISMETFADFAAGELVFDARVKEKRSFYAAS